MKVFTIEIDAPLAATALDGAGNFAARELALTSVAFEAEITEALRGAEKIVLTFSILKKGEKE